MSAKKRGPLLIISTYGLRKGVGTRITYVFRYLTRRNTQRIIKTYKRNMINCFLHHFPHSAVFCILLSCQEYYSEYLLSKVQYLLLFPSTRTNQKMAQAAIAVYCVVCFYVSKIKYFLCIQQVITYLTFSMRRHFVSYAIKLQDSMGENSEKIEQLVK